MSSPGRRSIRCSNVEPRSARICYAGPSGWCEYRREEEPEIVGVVLTRSGGVRLPERLRRIVTVLSASAEPGDAHRLEGYRAYRRMMLRRPKPVLK